MEKQDESGNFLKDTRQIFFFFFSPLFFGLLKLFTILTCRKIYECTIQYLIFELCQLGGVRGVIGRQVLVLEIIIML